MKKRSQFSEIWRRLKRNKMAMAGLIILSIIVFLAIFAGKIFNYEEVVTKMDVNLRLQGPSMQHWLGCDEFGRDMLARLVYGSRVSLIVGVASIAGAMVIGCIIGAIAGFYGGKIDNVIMRIMDIFLAMPSILLAICIVAALGSSIIHLIMAIGVSFIPQFSRVVRAQVLSVRDEEFVEAARAIGSKDMTMIVREILPNCTAQIIVQATLGVASAILSTSGLSFIGLGIAPPAPEWGSMLAGGRIYIRDAVHITLFPGLAIVITILALNLLGDGLRDALDPRLKQ